MNDRAAVIMIGGKEYPMLLTTKATKEIAKRYGGLEHLGEKLMKRENFEQAIGEVVWLITLLANQGILVHNLQEPDDPQPLLTEEAVELLTSPADLAVCKDAIMEALRKGTERFVKSEDDGKTQRAGKRRRRAVCPPAVHRRDAAGAAGARGVADAARRPA